MLGGFWTSIGGKLADRWATVSAGALVFWLGAVAAWLIGHGGLRPLEQPLGSLAARPAPVQLAVLIAALLAVTGSGVTYSPVPGDVQPPDAPRYACPKGDYLWFRRHVGQPIRHCPTHRLPLVPG